MPSIAWLLKVKKLKWSSNRWRYSSNEIETIMWWYSVKKNINKNSANQTKVKSGQKEWTDRRRSKKPKQTEEWMLKQTTWTETNQTANNWWSIKRCKEYEAKNLISCMKELWMHTGCLNPSLFGLSANTN